MRVEAKRLAKTIIKEEIKRQGMKVSWFEPNEIAKAADEYIKHVPSIVKRAERNIKERYNRTTTNIVRLTPTIKE